MEGTKQEKDPQIEDDDEQKIKNSEGFRIGRLSEAYRHQ